MENNLGAPEQNSSSYMYYYQQQELAERNIFLEAEIRKKNSEMAILRGTLFKYVSREAYSVVVEQNKVIAQNNQVLFNENEELRKKLGELEEKVINVNTNLEGMTTHVNELNKKNLEIQSQHLFVCRDKMKLEKKILECFRKLEEEKKIHDEELERQKGLWKEQILSMNSRCVDLVNSNNNLVSKINHLEKENADLKREAEVECQAKREMHTLSEYLQGKIKLMKEGLAEFRETHKSELEEQVKKFTEAETRILNMKSGMRFSCNQVSQLTTENESLLQKLGELEQKSSKLKEEYGRKIGKQREVIKGKLEEINELKSKLCKLEKNEGKIVDREVLIVKQSKEIRFLKSLVGKK